MATRTLFSDSDLARIREAVDRAEEGTAGEIVPYVVAASDGYEGTVWRGAALGSLLGALAAAILHAAAGAWGLAPVLWIAAPPLLGAAAGYLATSLIPPLRRALLLPDVVDRRVRRRAAVAFLEEEVFRTAERTGILIFLSLFEHRAVVLGDSGINAKVGSAEWQGIVDRLTAGIRGGRPADAMIEAMGECGELLERRGVEIRADDRNELSDELRLRDR